MPDGGEARMPAEPNAVWFDGPEKHLLETADIDAPTFMGVIVPLLLYADNLLLMFESASGLQKQLDALASFCEQRQLTVNLSKTKVVTFESNKVLCVTSGSMVQWSNVWTATSIWGLVFMPPRVCTLVQKL